MWAIIKLLFPFVIKLLEMWVDSRPTKQERLNEDFDKSLACGDLSRIAALIDELPSTARSNG